MKSFSKVKNKKYKIYLEKSVSVINDTNMLLIMKLCREYDYIEIIVKCEKENLENNEENYICIIKNKKTKNAILLGITIKNKWL